VGNAFCELVHVERLVNQRQEIRSVIVGDNVLTFVSVMQVVQLFAVFVRDRLDRGLAHFGALVATDVIIVALKHLESDVLRSDLSVDQALHKLRAEGQLAVESQRQRPPSHLSEEHGVLVVMVNPGRISF